MIKISGLRDIDPSNYLFQVDAATHAQQWTINQFEVFHAVQAKEFLGKIKYLNITY